MTYKIIKDAFGKVKHWYINENEFVFDGVNYEKDKDNGRCYYLEESRCLRADCDGKLVKRRISAKEYTEILGKCKAECAEPEIEEIIENKREEKYVFEIRFKEIAVTNDRKRIESESIGRTCRRINANNKCCYEWSLLLPSITWQNCKSIACRPGRNYRRLERAEWKN